MVGERAGPQGFGLGSARAASGAWGGGDGRERATGSRRWIANIRRAADEVPMNRCANSPNVRSLVGVVAAEIGFRVGELGGGVVGGHEAQEVVRGRGRAG